MVELDEIEFVNFKETQIPQFEADILQEIEKQLGKQCLKSC